jgi:hypothetical protein
MSTTAQTRTLIPVSDLRIWVALAVPKADPASLHKESANTILETGIGRPKADAEHLERAGDELLLAEERVPTQDRQVPKFREQVHEGGLPMCPNV